MKKELKEVKQSEQVQNEAVQGDANTFQVKKQKRVYKQHVMIKTYAEAGDMIAKVEKICGKTKAEVAFDMIKFAFDHLEIVE